MYFFAPQRHSADQFPITCSDSPHFEEAAQWLYYRGTGRRGLIKLTGVITRSLPCHGLEWRMEQRCDGEGHAAIVLQCAQWVFPVTPCRSRFKDWGEGPDSDGWQSARDAHRAYVPRCLCLPCTSPKSSLFSWLRHFKWFRVRRALVLSGSF